MLFDPNWQKPKVKADVFSLGSLIAWLEKMPPEVAYDYKDCRGGCLLDLYISSVTGKRSRPTPETHHTTCGSGDNYVLIARPQPWTFGAALARARKAAETS